MKVNPTFSKTLALVAPVTLLTITHSFGASDYLLEIDGIKGESSDTTHKDSIAIESFSWGATNTTTVSGGGGAGKVSLQDFHFVMKVDKASPKLMLACATGQRIPSLRFFVSKPDATGGTKDYYVITLSDVLVSSYQSSGAPPPPGASTVPPLTASVSFNYAKIRWDYIAQDNTTESVEFDSTPAVP
jgi:type VI secretion system secreted protein Hcp